MGRVVQSAMKGEVESVEKVLGGPLRESLRRFGARDEVGNGSGREITMPGKGACLDGRGSVGTLLSKFFSCLCAGLAESLDGGDSERRELFQELGERDDPGRVAVKQDVDVHGVWEGGKGGPDFEVLVQLEDVHEWNEGRVVARVDK